METWGLAYPNLPTCSGEKRSAPGPLNPTTPLCFLSYRAADTLKGGATLDTAQVFNGDLGEKPPQRNPQDLLGRTKANARTLLTPVPTIPWSRWRWREKMNLRSDFEPSSMHTHSEPQRTCEMVASLSQKGGMSQMCFPPKETQNFLNLKIHEDTCKV